LTGISNHLYDSHEKIKMFTDNLSESVIKLSGTSDDQLSKNRQFIANKIGYMMRILLNIEPTSTTNWDGEWDKPLTFFETLISIFFTEGEENNLHPSTIRKLAKAAIKEMNTPGANKTLSELAKIKK